MTDLERARLARLEEKYRGLAGDVPPFGDVVFLLRMVAAARREGAAEIRERALEAARDGVRVAFGERRDQEFIDQNDVIGSIEDAFASVLPLTPEEPA